MARRSHPSLICPDCDVELEPIGDDAQTRSRPADDWACPSCVARWHLSHSGLMIEVD
jgi:hypothetical protein